MIIAFCLIQMEFAVNMTCEGCVKSVKNSLQGVDGTEHKSEL